MKRDTAVRTSSAFVDRMSHKKQYKNIYCSSLEELEIYGTKVKKCQSWFSAK